MDLTFQNNLSIGNEVSQIQVKDEESTTLMISNIPKMLTKEGLLALVRPMGEIICFDIDRNNSDAGRYFITFSTLHQAQSIQKLMNNRPPLNLHILVKNKDIGLSTLRNVILPEVIQENDMLESARKEKEIISNFEEIQTGHEHEEPEICNHETIEETETTPTFYQNGTPENFTDQVEESTEEKSKLCVNYLQETGGEKFENEMFTFGQPLFLENEETGDCCECNKITSNRCSRCSCFYCSQNCQIENWQVHKTTCKKELNITGGCTALNSNENVKNTSDESNPKEEVLIYDKDEYDSLTDAINATHDLFDKKNLNETIDASKDKVSFCKKPFEIFTEPNKPIIEWENSNDSESYYSCDETIDEDDYNIDNVSTENIKIQDKPNLYKTMMKPLEIVKEMEVVVLHIVEIPRKRYAVMPIENLPMKSQVAEFLQKIECKDIDILLPSTDTSCLVSHNSWIARANVLGVSKSDKTVQVYLVDEGLEEIVPWTKIFCLPEQLSNIPSLATNVELFIPENEPTSPSKRNGFYQNIKPQDIVTVSPVIYRNNCMQVTIIASASRDPETSSALRTEDIASIKMTNEQTEDHCDENYSQNSSGNLEHQFSLELNTQSQNNNGLSSIAYIPEFDLPLHSTFSKSNLTQKILFSNLNQQKVLENCEYLSMDFGEKSNEYYLIPIYEVDSSLDTALIESGLYPCIDREVEVGEVFAAPRHYYNRTKLLRVEVMKIYKNHGAEIRVKVRGVDVKYRNILKVEELRPLSLDSIKLPVRSVQVNLHQVVELPRKDFKAKISDLCKKMLRNPLTVKIVHDEKPPVVDLIVDGEVCINAILQDDFKEENFPVALLDHSEKASNLEIVGKLEIRIEDYLMVIRKFAIKNFKNFPLLKEGFDEVVLVLHCEGPELICICPLEKVQDLDKITSKCNRMAKLCEDISSDPVIGKVYLSQCGADNAWYRGLVVARITPYQVRIFFLDYGWIEDVPVSVLKPYRMSKTTKFMAVLCDVDNSSLENPHELEYSDSCVGVYLDEQRLIRARRKEVEVMFPPIADSRIQVTRRRGPIHTIVKPLSDQSSFM